ncbi:hypothetical protein BGZ65_009442, partial [Modicella reniformis]
MPYPASTLLRSVATELLNEIKRLYRKGSIELEKKLQNAKAKGFLPVGSHSTIKNDLPAIENFVLLNRSSKKARKIVPLVGSQRPFIAFSERELCILFWQHEALKNELQKLILKDYKDKNVIPSSNDLSEWLRTKSPGVVITEMLSNIGRDEPRTRRRGPRGFKDMTSVMDLARMREHLQVIQHKDFNPNAYEQRGYVHRGTIRTDGFQLRLLVFKLKELQGVRYKRFRAEILPLRINTTVGGVDYFLTEVRNVVKTPQDVANLWGCAPDDIKILGLDLGQACVVGASAILPRKKDTELQTPCDPDAQMETDDGLPTSSEPLIFHNLAIKQKAVYQPHFKHRRWMQEEKSKDPGNGLRSIQDIETALPPLRGEGASLTTYLDEYKAVKGQLDDFYNGNNRFKKH